MVVLLPRWWVPAGTVTVDARSAAVTGWLVEALGRCVAVDRVVVVVG